MHSTCEFLLVAVFIAVAFGDPSTELSPAITHNNTVKCEDIDRFSSHIEQCEFVRQHCSDSKNSPGIVNYFEFYYCTMSESRDLRWLAVMVLLLQLAFLFVFLGTAASDYFCPNLSTLSEALNLPDDVAGVTFLAFGNSAPDLFSSAVAMHAADATGLALGSILGAGLFVGVAVVGFVALTAKHGKHSLDHGKPMQISVEPRIFLRDVGFFLLSVLLLGVMLVDGKMYWWEGIIMLLVYFVYIAIVLIMGWKQRKQRSRTRCDGQALRCCARIGHLLGETTEDSNDHNILIKIDAPDDHLDPTLLSCRNSNETDADFNSLFPTRPSSPSNSRLLNVPTYLDHDVRSIRSYLSKAYPCSIAPSHRYRKRSKSIDAPLKVIRHRFHAIHKHQSSTKSLASALALWGAWKSLEARDEDDLISNIAEEECRYSHTEHDCPIISLNEGIEILSPDERRHSVLRRYTTTRLSPRGEIRRLIATLAGHLFPIYNSWPTMNFLSRIVGILNIPVCIVLGLTIPVVSTTDETEVMDDDVMTEDGEHSPLLRDARHRHLKIETIQWHYRYILYVQCILAPLFVLYATGYWDANLVTLPNYFPAWTIAACISSVSFFILIFVCGPHRNIRRLALHSFPDLDSSIPLRSPENILLPWRHPILSFIGFIVGILWIYLVASEVIGLLKALGEILEISEAILGITVNAIGNSVGDFVSNITMARMGYPNMAIAASFAGPLLNLLITLGVSGVWGTAIVFPLSTNLLITTSSLLFMQLLNLTVIPLSGFKITRTFGVTLVFLYGVIIAITVSLCVADIQVPGLPRND